jgi:hypothetical protein
VGASISVWCVASWLREDDEIIVVSEFLVSLACYCLRQNRLEHQSGN